MRVAAPWREVGSRLAEPRWGSEVWGRPLAGARGSGGRRALSLRPGSESQVLGRVGAEHGPKPSRRALITVTTGELSNPVPGPSLGLAHRGRSPHLPVSPVWQHPFINVFRQFKVDEWKRSAKEGDVATVMVSGRGDLAAGWGPLLYLGYLAPPLEGRAGGTSPGAPWLCGGH